MDRSDIVLKAIEKLKTNPFKTTAIKIELEADLDRDDSEGGALLKVLDNLATAIGVAKPEVVNIVDNDSDCNICGGWNEDNAHIHNPMPGIVYARFYNDGSVDSELTITVSLEKNDNVFLLPKIVEAWDAYCKESDKYDIDGAGLHMALLNTDDCSYPSISNRANFDRFDNFKKSMQLLLPSLYFLAAHSAHTRGLDFRQPRIHATEQSHGSDKFAAVNYTHGAVEFRVFDTCYDKPNAILDNVVVMSKTMKFWTREYRPSGLESITNMTWFGGSYGHGYELEELFNRNEHVALLNAGLRLLKPAYYTITQLKEERGFSVTANTFLEKDKQIKADAELAYDEYVDRWEWNRLRVEHDMIEDSIRPRYISESDPEYAVLASSLRSAISSTIEILKDKKEFVLQRIEENKPSNGFQLSPDLV